MILTGGCCCGAIRYELGGDAGASPYHLTTCHCPTCRKVCGAANVAWLSVVPASLRITKGAPASFHSSPTVTRTFCGNCGTQLTYQNSDLAGDIDVTICSLDDPEPFAPQDHTFAAYRLSWDLSADGKPAYQRTRAEG